MKRHASVTITLLLLLLVGAYVLSGKSRTLNAEYVAFAECLEEEGAIFYGAFWCPHCIDQKRKFKTGSTALPYVECSTPERERTEICEEMEITSYPTWIFADGTRAEGGQELAFLADQTGCALPDAVDATTAEPTTEGNSSSSTLGETPNDLLDTLQEVSETIKEEVLEQ